LKRGTLSSGNFSLYTRLDKNFHLQTMAWGDVNYLYFGGEFFSPDEEERPVLVKMATYRRCKNVGN